MVCVRLGFLISGLFRQTKLSACCIYRLGAVYQQGFFEEMKINLVGFRGIIGGEKAFLTYNNANMGNIFEFSHF